MTNQLRDKLVKALLTPQVLVAVLLLVAAVALLTGIRRVQPPAAPVVDLGAAAAQTVSFDARLVLADDAQLEWQKVVRIDAPDTPPLRLAAVLAALRQALLDEGLWPTALPAPFVYLETIDRAVYAVLDVRTPEPIAVSVARERALLRAITATTLANGVDEVRFLRDGRPAETLLGHVAVPSSL